MKSRSVSGRVRGVAVALLLLAFAAPGAQFKPIRLRNEVLLPSAAKGIEPANKATANAPVSGLFLIQFSHAPSPELRGQLAASGVELLQYIPSDTFVARLERVRLSSLRALTQVAWVGDYRPALKVHKKLQSAAVQVPAGGSLPVACLVAPRANPADLGAARSSFAPLRQEARLRLGTVLRGRLNPGRIEALARNGSVLWVELAPDMKLVDEVASGIVAGEAGPNLLLPQSLGYDGTGVTVAVADSGLNNGNAATMHPDLFGRTPDFFYYGSLLNAADEHSHGTHVAGIIAGNAATGEMDENGALFGLGVAPGASIVAQRIFDGAGNYEPPANGFAQLTRDATDAGAVIGSNSWGDDTQGQYDLSAMEFDELVRDATGSGTNNRPYILEFSAGNAGPGAQTLGSPAVAKNVIATGACENDRPDLLVYADGPDVMADFSSRGPCEDGRLKPDLVAPGTWISSLQSASASDEYAWLAIDGYYQYQGGTSQAGPHASGAAAVFVQFYRQTHANATPSPALVKAALINSATALDPSFGNEPAPNMDEGWGRVDLAPLFDSPLTFEFLDQTAPLTNSQVFTNHVLIASPEEPLKITLAYTDVPGFPGAIPALVNDLDLEVEAPGGSLYRGNRFSGGESIPNAANPDSINNVEAVHLSAPVPGEYTVRVRARSVVSDIYGKPGLPRQDFALVVSGLIPAPGTSAVVLDRHSYTAASQIKITVIDSDQAGNPSAGVLARSTVETNGESLLVSAAGVGGSFTGSVATATGPAAPDGRLQIANGNLIQVSYFDTSAGSNRVATAVADLAPPVLRAVFAQNSFGQATVSWLSDEPATSIVYYGTNSALASLTSSVSNSGLVMDHSLNISSLVKQRTYYYYVVSSDEAGNNSTNNNGGQFYSFVAAPTAPVLLVDEYYPDPVFGFPAPPLSGYTDALNALGVSYDVWDDTAGNAPTNVLGSYRAVIWRVPELSGTWTVPERYAISNYLQSGGSLFVASMQLLSRLELDAMDTNYIRTVLQVQSYVPDDNGSTLAAEIVGSPYESVGNGVDVVMDYAIYENLWSVAGVQLIGPDISETMTPKASAAGVFRNDYGDVVGLRWPAPGQQAPGRLVFLSCPLDAVPMSGGVNDRIHLLRNALAFLAPGASGLANVSLDSSAYTLPSLATVEVGDAILAGHGTVNVGVSSTTQTNGFSLALAETSNPGVFLGSFQVISATNAPAAGKLRAAHGDTIRVEYLVSGSNTLLTATASVDTVPPVISDVTTNADYQEAMVSFLTSEPADALVQFGESPLLGRSSYDADFVTSHEVILANLKPDQTYYFRLASRDPAGNMSLDTNLYTLHTRAPLYAPWSDSMDAGAGDWSVFTADGSDTQWTLGVPDNGKETQASSPPNAWGSNLKGAVVGYAETFLISPAIYLPAGAQAALHFAHSYEFNTDSDLDILEYGQVLVITNNSATTAIALSAYEEDFTFGYEQETLDLTPFAGQLVYLVWNYELLTFDDRLRPGWLVDDVSITISNGPVGTLQITNNLWQSAYSLSGPTNLSGTGLGLWISNAPAGQYVVHYSVVPYYIAPASQTNNLAAGATLVVHGNYTFPDANTNAISDLWEVALFGGLSTNRTRQDYEAFIAGADPNSAPAPFHVTAQLVSNTVCRLQWPAFAGQHYRVHVSTNLTAWSLYSTDWIQTNRFELPAASPAGRSFFKVEAQSTLAPSLRLSLLRPSGNSPYRLSWPASVGRGYQVQASSNAVTWTPVSIWFQATNSTLIHPLPSPAKGAPYLFRVQVLP